MNYIWSRIKSRAAKYWTLLIVFIFFGWLFWNLLSSHMLYSKDDGLYSGGSTWGDLAYHLTLASNFKERGLLPTLTANPIFAGSKLSYPFFADYLSALLTKTGLSLRSALILPSLFFLLILTALISLLTLKITRNKIASFLTPFIFFFNGSIFGLWFFWQDWQKSGVSLWKFLDIIEKQYALAPELNIYLSNIIDDFILPQRTFIFGFAVGLGAICFLWSHWENSGRAKLFYAGLITAILPTIHLHSFMTISMVAGFLFLIELSKTPKYWKKNVADWLYFILPAALLGLPQVLLMLPPTSGGFLRFQFGWLKGNDPILWFWIKNLSPHIFIFLWAWFRARSKVRSFYLAFWGVFFVANLVVFEPYDFNNSKFILWWYLASSLIAAGFLGDLLSKFSLRRIAAVCAIFILMISVGLLSVWREYNLSWLIFSKEDLALADFVTAKTAYNSLFLTSSRHNHPVPTLSGRRIIMGYPGWLWTFGINYQTHEADVFKMYSGGEDALVLLKKYEVNYVVTEENTAVNLNINREFFAQNFPLVYQSQKYSIFKIE